MLPVAQSTPRLIDDRTGKFLLAATTLTIVINAVIIFFFGTYHDLIFGAIQCLWTLICIYLLAKIYYSTTDKTLKSISSIFGIAMVPWAVTLALWKIMLPAFFNVDLAYYVTGFGFLVTYVTLIYGLLNITGSKRWYLNPSTNSLINGLWAFAVLSICAFVLLNLDWSSNRLMDTIILLLYLVCDITVLALGLKLACTNLGAETKYVVLVIFELIAINLIADFLFELRWLIPVKYLLGYRISFAIDVVYNISLVFMVLALLFYVSRNRTRALDKINATLGNTRLFIDDFIKNSPDAMCIYDASGNAIMVNDQFLRLFGLEEVQAIGKLNLFEQLAEIDPSSRMRIAGLKNGETIILSRIRYSPPGQIEGPKYLTVKVYPMFDADRAIAYYSGIFDDMTEKVKTEEALRESKAQAELYLDLMGHDITNMHQIALGYLELVQDVREDKIGKEFIDKPIEVLQRSTLLIRNVRKLQKLKEGSFDARDVDVCRVLSNVQREFGGMPGKTITLNLNGCENEHCFVRGNELIYDVFANLVSNAIKHTGGRANIVVDLRIAEENRIRYCRVTVEDDGPGIPDDFKDKIFSRLLTGDGKSKGMGLGLYLVKSLVESYGGKVWVEDRVPGDHTKGAKFVVMLPAVESH